jgi:hypothetical protein
MEEDDELARQMAQVSKDMGVRHCSTLTCSRGQTFCGKTSTSIWLLALPDGANSVLAICKEVPTLRPHGTRLVHLTFPLHASHRSKGGAKLCHFRLPSQTAVSSICETPMTSC